VIKKTNKLVLVVGIIVAMLVGLLTPLITPPKVHAATILPTYRFSKPAGSNNNAGHSFAFDIAEDAAGNTYTSGYYNGTVTFDGVGGSDTRTSTNDDAFLTKRTASGAYVWTKTFDASAVNSNSYAQGVVVDKDGNIIMAGQWQGTVKFDGVGGSDSKTTTADFNSYVTKFSPTGTYLFTKIFSQSSGNSSNADQVQTDSSGNIYIGGYWDGTATFDGVGGTDTRTSTHANSYLTKYTSSGSYVYTKVLDTSASGSGAGGDADVGIDSGGNVYVTGTWIGTVVFDGVGGSDSRTSANNNSYVTKYSPSGTYLYTKSLDATSGSIASVNPYLAIDPSGNVYWYSVYDGMVKFDGVGGTHSGTSATHLSSFLTKFSPSGAYLYTKSILPVSGDVSPARVTTDKFGRVYITGNWQTGSVTLDGAGGTDTHTTAGDFSGFIVQYNADGSYGWSRTIDANGAGDNVDVTDLAGLLVDAQGNLYLASDYSGNVLFDGTGGSDHSPVTTVSTAFVLSYHVSDPTAAPAAPNTGYALPPQTPWLTYTEITAATLFGATYLLRKHRS